ncbi:hypothetical protein MKS87_10845 [Bacillus subtilis]|uniref:hypothetical protein n=1 Tax=Bacillus subtilis TaxID=1423 RepID=UPI001F074407|nr:hypothetical protein [Bacillus subtilis]UML50891.1 hypothetical protein MKS87_10845 [Bacillus subtilis]
MIEIFKDTEATHDLVYHSKINTFVWDVEFDIVLSDSKELNKCYFVKYFNPHGINRKCDFAVSSIDIFSEGKRLLSKNEFNFKIIKAIHVTTSKDVTKIVSHLSKSINNPFPIVKEVVYLD